MPVDSRRSLSRELEARLERYFDDSKVCVVTNSVEAEWHHLDDNKSNTVFTNLVPLATSLNRNLRDVRKRATSYEGSEQVLVLRPTLQPEKLLDQASINFSKWKVGRAYGCARLAFYVGKQYRHQEKNQLLSYASKTLHFARHRVQYELIHDILRRDILPLLYDEEPISSWTAFSIGQGFAGLLAEHGLFRKARDVYQILDDLKLAPIAEDIAPSLYSALLRRDAMAMLVDDPRNARAAKLLSEATNIDPTDENICISIANTQAWLYLDQGIPNKAREILEPYYEIYTKKAFSSSETPKPVSVTVWNLAELFNSFGVALRHDNTSRNRNKIQQAFRLASKLFEVGGAKLNLLHPESIRVQGIYWLGNTQGISGAQPLRPILSESILKDLMDAISLLRKRVRS